MSEKPSDTKPRNKGCGLLLDENTNSPLIIDPCNRMRGWEIHSHGAYLPKGASDEEVAAFCGPRRWGLITLDDMRYSPKTVLVLYAFRVRVFKLVRHKDTPFTELQAALIVARKRIIEIMRTEPDALFAHVQLKGHVTVMNRLEQYRRIPESQLKTVRKYYKSGPFDAEEIAKQRIQIA